MSRSHDRRRRSPGPAADALAEKRRALPWVAVDAEYTFGASDGTTKSFTDLFGERSQLLVYHFMFGADWEKPCPSCSFWADHFGPGARGHLRERDVELAVVSVAPAAKLSAWAKRADWTFPWYSSGGSAFNADYGVTLDENVTERTYNFAPTTAKGEMPGFSAFIKTADGIFHTYSAYSRGLEPANATYGMLDMVPLGRDESALDWPMQWVKRLAER